jgi:hypothetical protein
MEEKFVVIKDRGKISDMMWPANKLLVECGVTVGRLNAL